MIGAQNCPVTEFFPESGHIGNKLGFFYLGQNLLAEEAANSLQLLGDGGILVGQVSMAGPAVDDAQHMTAGGKIKGDGLDHRILFVKEVDGDHAANGRGHLVHQTAGFSEEYILRVLTDHGDLRLGDFAVKEHVVDDRADEYLVSGRGAKTGAGENGRGHIGIKALHLTAQLGESGGNTADQRQGGIDLSLYRLQLVQRHLAHGVAFGKDADGVGAVDLHGGYSFQVHGTGQDTAPLMVCVVTADLGTAGGREVPLRRIAKGGGKPGI